MDLSIMLNKDIIFGPINYVEQNGHLKILIRSVWGNDGHGGGICAPDHFRLIKTALVFSISNWINPFSSFYNKAFYRNIICPQGVAYNPLPEVCGRMAVILKGIISDLSNTSNRMGIPNLGRKYLGKWWLWGGGICPPITFV